jgi:hypothetical protein
MIAKGGGSIGDASMPRFRLGHSPVALLPAGLVRSQGRPRRGPPDSSPPVGAWLIGLTHLRYRVVKESSVWPLVA